MRHDNMKNVDLQHGQTLVSLLVFSVMAISVAAAATAVMINTSQATSITESRMIAQMAADSGIENALLRLIRDPNYAGETLTLDDSTVVTTVTGDTTKTITSTATEGVYTQTDQATVQYINYRLTVTSWNTLY